VQVKSFWQFFDKDDRKTSCEELDKKVNDFLRGLPVADIVKTETVAFPSRGQDVSDAVLVLVWLRGDATDPSDSHK